MRSEIEDYPLSLFTAAFKTVTGRVLSVLLAWVVGTLLGAATQPHLLFNDPYAGIHIFFLPAVLVLGLSTATGYFAGAVAVALSLWLAFGNRLRIEAFFLSMTAVLLFVAYALATEYNFTLTAWRRFAEFAVITLLIMIALRVATEVMLKRNE